MTAAARPSDSSGAAAPAAGLEVDILHEAGAWDEAAADVVRRAALRAYGAVRGAAPAELSVMLADDARVAALNKTYRGKDGPTNVLSFPSADIAGMEAVLLGDVVLARETIAREAEAQAKRFDDHLAHLVVHGVLHLLGHDHASDAEADQMEALEREILQDLGIADPYDMDRASRNA
ncbi:MAG: rRNA maturation RNase YbeY [Parvibaculum sp.]|nr:rRNA maturation RNase YbeY [Parvibaculum sp.]